MKKTTQQYAAEIMGRHKLTLTSEYTSAHGTITFTCENGHENTGVATNVLQRGYACKECKFGYKIEPKIVWTPALLSRVQSMLDEGTSVDEISKALSTTNRAIYNTITKYDLVNTLQSQRSATAIKSLESTLAEQGRTIVTAPDTLVNNVISTCSNGHTTSQRAANIVYHNTGCPICFLNQPSKKEEELLSFISSSYDGWIVTNDRCILEGKELDIVLPDLGLAFEFNGTFWHSERKVDKYYHLNKTLGVEAIEYQLIHVHEYLWNHKQSILKNKILSLITKQPRVGARKTNIKEVSWAGAKVFLDNNHIQGAGAPSKYNYGLYLGDELVAVCTFQKPRFSSTHDMELVRYATSKNITGGLSKCIAHAKTTIGFKSLITYALRDWSTGKAYKAVGFNLVGSTEPNYTYYKKDTAPISRYKAQKHLLSKLLPLFDPKLSEAENMQLNGWLKVYDTGSLIFELNSFS